MPKKLVRKSLKKVGAPPGTLVHVGEKPGEKTRISAFYYNEGRFEERILKNARECISLKDEKGVAWINVDGLHELEVIETIGKDFDLHPLVLEDILNAEHRPKLEDFDSYLFMVLKMLSYDRAKDEIHTEQVSLILGPSYVLSFQERQGDVFDGVRQRISNSKGRIRKMGADYLAYALLDAVVDGYFGILEKVGDQIESLEDQLIVEPTPEILHRIHHFKREMILLRKSVWPLRELINGLQRNESGLLSETTGVFLRDVYDHTIQIMDTVETFRDIISGMLDLYLSSMGNRMNEVMKVLTIIATVFIPLTFIAGIYGMNFENMPELKWHWGYPFVWLIMAGTGFGMFLFFRKKKWL